MKDSLIYDMLIDPFTDGVCGVLFGILSWILTLIICGLIAWGSLYLVDSVGLQEKKDSGVVVNKWFEPSHTTTSFMMVGKVLIPQTHHYPDSWMVEIKIHDLTDNVSLYEIDWNSLSINQKVSCTYKEGRIYNSLYIGNVSW